jgi:hypothetical protein
MKLVITKELKALRRMTVGELKDKYLELFGEETRSHNKSFLIRRIAWQMQALAEGGLSERARRRADELADDSRLRTRAPKASSSGGMRSSLASHPFPSSNDRRLPMPGTVLTREYHGETVAVTVLGSGFEYEGDIYRSLTAVARAVTGSHWNGYHFFGLTMKGGRS